MANTERKARQSRKKLNHIETDIGWIKKILWVIVVPVWLLFIAAIINFIFK